jgi:leader peptidase (prepilin peptidase)/N-methyltransferase
MISLHWMTLGWPANILALAVPHLESVTVWQGAYFAVMGLVIGSFLNVLIHRLPLMILHADQQGTARFNLRTPRSHCPHCLHSLQWYELIPVVSFLLNRARCRHCKMRISNQYPLVEITNSALFVVCLLKFGLTWDAVLACIFCAILLALALIDAKTFLLPDTLTQALLWVGLMGSAASFTPVPLTHALAGVVLGYGVLWVVSRGFEVFAGKEGMGQGDLKLLAGLGAWVGAGGLLHLLLLASISGLIFGVIQKYRGQLGDNGHFAFGPFLALSGFTCFFLGFSLGA